MSKTSILVLAAGRRRMPVALRLPDEGFLVDARVHRVEHFKTKGVEIVVDPPTDVISRRTVMIGQSASASGAQQGTHHKAAAICIVVAAEQQPNTVVK